MKIYFYNVPNEEMASKAFKARPKISRKNHYFFAPASGAKDVIDILEDLGNALTNKGGTILVHMKLTDNVSDAFKELATKFGFIAKKEEQNWSKDELKELFVLDSEDERASVYEALTPDSSLIIVKKEINMILTGYLNYLTDQPNGIDGAIVLNEDGDVYATSIVAAGVVGGKKATPLNLDQYPTAVRHFRDFIKDAKNFGRGEHEETTLIFSAGIIKIIPYQSQRVAQELLIILINSTGRSMSGTLTTETKAPLLEIRKCIENLNYKPDAFAGLSDTEQNNYINPPPPKIDG